jgi:hypothetical protein
LANIDGNETRFDPYLARTEVKMPDYCVVNFGEGFAVSADDQAVIRFDSEAEAVAFMKIVDCLEQTGGASLSNWHTHFPKRESS